MSLLSYEYITFITSPLSSFIFGLCWGSFLNVVAHRLLDGASPFTGRSRCPNCAAPLVWHDLIPVLSWLWLQRRCRSCKKNISWLYPFIELLTALTITGMTVYVAPHYWPATFLYASALLVTIRTDIADFTIMRQTTLFILPLAPIAAHYGLIPITTTQSIIGIIAGASALALISLVFWLMTGKIGLGQGDIELCALIGGTTGILGWWISLLIASVVGTVVGLIAMALVPHPTDEPVKIPFGAFLAVGSLFFVLFENPIKNILGFL